MYDFNIEQLEYSCIKYYIDIGETGCGRNMYDFNIVESGCGYNIQYTRVEMI